MSKKKVKYYRVKYGGIEIDFMTGLEVSLVQMSGGHVKVLRRATKEEYDKHHAK